MNIKTYRWTAWAYSTYEWSILTSNCPAICFTTSQDLLITVINYILCDFRASKSMVIVQCIYFFYQDWYERKGNITINFPPSWWRLLYINTHIYWHFLWCLACQLKISKSENRFHPEFRLISLVHDTTIRFI